MHLCFLYTFTVNPDKLLCLNSDWMRKWFDSFRCFYFYTKKIFKWLQACRVCLQRVQWPRIESSRAPQLWMIKKQLLLVLSYYSLLLLPLSQLRSWKKASIWTLFFFIYMVQHNRLLIDFQMFPCIVWFHQKKRGKNIIWINFIVSVFFFT